MRLNILFTKKLYLPFNKRARFYTQVDPLRVLGEATFDGRIVFGGPDLGKEMKEIMFPDVKMLTKARKTIYCIFMNM